MRLLYLLFLFVISLSDFAQPDATEPKAIGNISGKDSLPVIIKTLDYNEIPQMIRISKGDVQKYITWKDPNLGKERELVFFFYKKIRMNDSISIYFIFNENEEMFMRKIYMSTVNENKNIPISTVLFFMNFHDAEIHKGQLTDFKSFQVTRFEGLPISKSRWEGDEEILSYKLFIDYYELFPEGKIKLISTSAPVVKKFAMDSLGELVER